MYEDTVATGRAKTFVLAVAIVLGGVMLLGGVVAVAALSSKPRQAGSVKTAAAAPSRPAVNPAAANPTVNGDPWPECAMIRQWLHENTPEPATLELIRWESRKIWQPLDRPRDDIVNVVLKYRGRNQYGGFSVATSEFVIDGGKISVVNTH